MKFAIPITLLSLLVSQISPAAYYAHEWGTFTSLVGSDGKTQPGMYHEDEVLPDFVHTFGETRASHQTVALASPRPQCRRGKGCLDDAFFDRNIITQKMETPVIYFYADKEEHVDVNVKFPNGIFTETYPAPVRSIPTVKDLVHPQGGEATFSVDLYPQLPMAPPEVDSANIYGHARNVASSYVSSGGEVEKFIFYRGLGQFQPRISIRSSRGALNISAAQHETPQAAFLVDVNEKGQVDFITLSLPLNQVIDAASISVLKTHAQNRGSQAGEAIVAALQQAGLYRDEAQAMFDTWKHGYLQVPGLRLLYVLPVNEPDAILPLSMTPSPTSLKRVFVGRVEILLDTEENRILNDIIKQGDKFTPSSLGRFAEPILQRIAQRYEGSDSSVRALLARLVEKAAHR